MSKKHINFLLFVSFFIANTSVFAQNDNNKKTIQEVPEIVELNDNTEALPSPPQETPSDDKVFTAVEKRPEFPGGEKALMLYLLKNIKYPQEALEKGFEGKVFVQFIVEKDGSVSNAKIIRGVGSGLNEEAIRIVKTMPKWNPGMQNGRNVRCMYNLPIVFKLK